MRLNDDAMWEVAQRFIAERVESIKTNDAARELLDGLIENLTEQGYGEEDSFGVLLVVDEAVMRRFQQGRLG